MPSTSSSRGRRSRIPAIPTASRSTGTGRPSPRSASAGYRRSFPTGSPARWRSSASIPVAWKLSLFPFALALTGSLAFLLGRWAPPLAVPAVFLLALGPAVLPSLNLMLDVPALALGAAGIRALRSGGRAQGRAARARVGARARPRHADQVLGGGLPGARARPRRHLPPSARSGCRAGRGGSRLHRLGGAADRALWRVAFPGRLRAAAHARESAGGRQSRRGGARQRGALLDDLPALAARRHRALSRPARERRARRAPPAVVGSGAGRGRRDRGDRLSFRASPFSQPRASSPGSRRTTPSS